MLEKTCFESKYEFNFLIALYLLREKVFKADGSRTLVKAFWNSN